MGNKQVKERPWKRQVLVAKEKYGVRVFDATTKKAFYASALTLLADRAGENYGYYSEPSPPTPPAISEETMQGLPMGRTRDALEQEWDDYRNLSRYYKKEYEDWRKISEALDTRDGRKAWDALRARRDYEYEYVELVELE